MQEDLQFRAGLDTSGFKRGLTSIQADAKGFASKTASQWKEAFSIGAIVAGIATLGNKMLELRRQAEDFGVSTDFLQTVGKLAVKFGGTAEDANAALTKLAEAIGQARTEGGAAAEKFSRFGISLYDVNGTAKDTETVFKEIANAYKNSSDAATKAALAFEFFGRTGRNINNILGEGGDGIDAYTAKMRDFGAVSVESVNAIADAWNNLRRTGGGIGGWLSEMTGRAVQGIGFAFANLGALSGGAGRADASNIAARVSGITGEGGQQNAGNEAVDSARRLAVEKEKIADVAERIAKVQRESGAETDADRLANAKMEVQISREAMKGEDDKIKKAEKLLKLEEAKAKVIEIGRKIEQDAGDLQMARMDRMSELIKSKKSAEETIADRTRFSMSELAGANLRGISDPTLRADAVKAREVQQLMERGERLRLSGRAGSLQEAQGLFTKADELRRGITSLKSEERFTSMDKNIAEVKDGINAFNKLANETGFVVRPIMGI